MRKNHTKKAGVWIGLGSNLGPRVDTLRKAAVRLISLPDTELLAASNLYKAAPVGQGFSRDFFNAVLAIETALSPKALLKECRRIESDLGRSRSESLDRAIDLDILLYGELVVRESGLEIPHPRMTERRFVLTPLSEISPDLQHPVLGLSSKQLLMRLGKGQPVERLPVRLIP